MRKKDLLGLERWGGGGTYAAVLDVVAVPAWSDETLGRRVVGVFFGAGFVAELECRCCVAHAEESDDDCDCNSCRVT